MLVNYQMLSSKISEYRMDEMSSSFIKLEVTHCFIANMTALFRTSMMWKESIIELG